MNITSTIKPQTAKPVLPKREKIEPRSEGYADAYEQASDTISQSESLRKMLWMGGTAAAGAYAGHLARPLLDGLGVNPYVTSAILGNVGGLTGIAIQSWNSPRFLPTLEDKAEQVVASCLGTAAGIGLAVGIHRMGSSLAPWFGAAGGLLVGYGLHHASTSLALRQKRVGLHNEIFQKTPAAVESKNLFTDDTSKVTVPARDYWLDSSLHPSTEVGKSKFVSPNLDYIQSYAEESLQGVVSSLNLKGTDPGPKPHLDENSSKEDYKNAEKWLQDVRVAKAFGSGHWRSFESNLEKWAEKSPNATTKAVFSATSSLGSSGGRERLFKGLDMDESFSLKAEDMKMTVYQMPGAGEEKPALLNISGHRADSTFFYKDAATAQKAAESYSTSKNYDALDKDSLLTILPLPGEIEGVAIVGTGPGRLCAMAQDESNKASFRVHVAALLDKALRDMESA